MTLDTSGFLVPIFTEFGISTLSRDLLVRERLQSVRGTRLGGYGVSLFSRHYGLRDFAFFTEPIENLKSRTMPRDIKSGEGPAVLLSVE